MGSRTARIRPTLFPGRSRKRHTRPFLIFDILTHALALRIERQSARMSDIKNGGLDQYGAELFKQQQFGTSGIEGVNGSVSERPNVKN